MNRINSFLQLPIFALYKIFTTMKIYITTLVIALLITSCKSEVKRDGYVISGNAKGIYNGVRVYLKVLDQNNRQVDIDTAIVMNEKFAFEGKAKDPELFYVHINSVNGILPIIVENGEITIDVDKDNLPSSKIYGSKTNDALNTYNEESRALIEKRQEISLALNEATQANDNIKTALLNKDLANLNSQMANSPFEFIQKNNNNFYSLILIEYMLKVRNVDFKQIIDAYAGLDESLKASTKGKEIFEQVDAVQKILETQARTEIGKIAPEFSAPTPEGKLLGLKDIKGKVTLIDFWAAWCGPCRRENPNIVQVYNKYHKKGLEIIGVSLDGVTRQGDPKAAWIKAIEDDKLTWHQISNLNYFNGPIAKMYNIQSIPSSFILDADGKIVAKNLRGPALEAKIAELLD